MQLKYSPTLLNRNKADLHRLMTVNRQTYLPPLNRCSLLFMQQITRGEKLTIKLHQKPGLTIPAWQELSIRNVWPHACRIVTFRLYMPDEWTATKKTERKFFFNILTFLAPNFVQDLVREARRMRQNHYERQQLAPLDITLTQEWATALLGEPFRPCKYRQHPKLIHLQYV